MRHEVSDDAVGDQTFMRQSELLLSAEEDSTLKFSLGLDPEAGEVITGTGGARKLRWAVGAEGKRGGVRVIYYFGGEDMPVILFAMYKKGRKDNLTQEEKAELKAIIKQIRNEYRKEKYR